MTDYEITRENINAAIKMVDSAKSECAELDARVFLGGVIRHLMQRRDCLFEECFREPKLASFANLDFSKIGISSASASIGNNAPWGLINPPDLRFR